MANKMTKRDYFEQIKKNYALTADEVAFIDKQIELLDKKNSSKKPTATQKANEGIKEVILDFLADGGRYTITDIIKNVPECSDLSNQKVSALVRGLVDEKKVVRVEDRRKAYFTLA